MKKLKTIYNINPLFINLLAQATNKSNDEILCHFYEMVTKALIPKKDKIRSSTTMLDHFPDTYIPYKMSIWTRANNWDKNEINVYVSIGFPQKFQRVDIKKSVDAIAEANLVGNTEKDANQLKTIIPKCSKGLEEYKVIKSKVHKMKSMADINLSLLPDFLK